MGCSAGAASPAAAGVLPPAACRMLWPLQRRSAPSAAHAFTCFHRLVDAQCASPTPCCRGGARRGAARAGAGLWVHHHGAGPAGAPAQVHVRCLLAAGLACRCGLWAQLHCCFRASSCLLRAHSLCRAAHPSRCTQGTGKSATIRSLLGQEQPAGYRETGRVRQQGGYQRGRSGLQRAALHSGLACRSVLPMSAATCSALARGCYQLACSPALGSHPQGLYTAGGRRWTQQLPTDAAKLPLLRPCRWR